MQLNTYFRDRNLQDVELLNKLNSEVLNIGGIEFRYILKEDIIENNLLGESNYTLDYSNGFSTSGLLEDGFFRDDSSMVGDLGLFYDERVKVAIDYNLWLNDVRTHLGDQNYSKPPKEGDYMVLINKNYSYDIFEIASVRRYDFYLQFNNKVIYRLFLKKAVIGETLYQNFTSTPDSPEAEQKMVEQMETFTNVTKPDPIKTPSMIDFLSNDIDNLGF